MGALVVILVVVLVGVVAVVMVGRSLMMEQAETDARLHDPHSHTVSYAVPDGVDPATVLAAVRASGFDGVIDPTGRTEHLLVGCEAGDRQRLRSVIEAVPVTRYDGTPLRDPVVFEDER